MKVYLSVFSVSFNPACHLTSLVVTYTSCSKLTNTIPSCVSALLILLSNDIELNPGDHYPRDFLNFMNWNLTSLVKINFERFQLIEAHNSLYNYDLISLCETNLNC